MTGTSMFMASDLIYMLPMLILVGAGILLVLAEAFFQGRDRSTLAGLTVASSLASLAASIWLYHHIGEGAEKIQLMNGMLVADRMSFVLTGLFASIAAAVALIAPAHQRTHQWTNGEFYGVLLLSTSGMAILAQASNLITVFLGVETMSIGVYVMTALRRRSKRGNEAAMKYFLSGAFATGFLLYGMALVYGASGTTSLLTMQAKLEATGNTGLLVAGVMMMVVAFGFKVSAVPFHMWAPDAYEGAPTPVTAFMAAGVKAAAIAAMSRVCGQALGGDCLPSGTLGWARPMVVIAALTITIGNIAAVRQDNIKRMLAYSSISHGGVLLAGLGAMGIHGNHAVNSILFYLIAYSVTTMASFAVIIFVGSRDRERLNVDDWAGLATKHPGAALVMTIALLSLGGMPPTAGFFAKFYIFKTVMETWDVQLKWLAVVGIVNSAISIFYYLRIVTAMYFREPTEPFTPTRSAGLTIVMVVSAVLILAMGILPSMWLALGS